MIEMRSNLGHRAAVIIVSQEHVLLMHRQRPGLDYFVMPGGKVEQGESIEEACIREAKEETGLDIELGEKLWEFPNQGRMDHYFSVKNFTGTPSLGGPELRLCSTENFYELQWISRRALPHTNLKPEEIKTRLLAFLDSQAW